MFLTNGSRPGRRGLLPRRSLSDIASALLARGSKGLNIESATGVGDTNYTMLATDRYVYINANFTAARTWTLPPASSVNPGGFITVADQQNTLTNTNTLTIQGSGSDTVDGGAVLLKTGLNVATFYTDGVSKWMVNRFVIAGTAANQLVQLDANAKLPAVDGSQLTGVEPVVTTTRGDIITRGASADGRLAMAIRGLSLGSNGTDAVYQSPDDFCCLSADFTINDNSTAQKVFNATANGSFTALANTAYWFQAKYICQTTGTTSHSWSVLFAGTAAITGEMSGVRWNFGSAPTILTAESATPASAMLVSGLISGAADNGGVFLWGVLRVTTGGTIIPQIKLSATTGGTVKILAGSYITFRNIGSNSVTSQGNWS